MTDRAITYKNVTAEDIRNGATQDWCYSDAYKEIYGIRPRNHTAEQEAWFWNNFEQLWAVKEQEEAEALDARRRQYNINFKNWQEYYDHLEQESMLQLYTDEEYDAYDLQEDLERA